MSASTIRSTLLSVSMKKSKNFTIRRAANCLLSQGNRFAKIMNGNATAAVTDRHTAVDLAEELRYLVEDCYPDAEKIVLVTDNLNTHHCGCLYVVFEPERAFAIAQKLEWHYTPEHASWLNIAEIELSVIGRQCLNRRIPSKEILKEQVQAWTDKRNNKEAKVDWRFTTKEARIKLKRLYPKL